MTDKKLTLAEQLAAEFHNRPYIGIEMNPEYVAIANARIARERSQMKMAI